MTIKTITQPPFVVDTEAEMDNTMPENSIFFCKDTHKVYELVSGSFTGMGVPARVQSSVTRAVNGTSFKPSATRDCLAVYTVKIVVTASIGSGQEGIMFFEISPDNTNWTEISRFDVGQTITLALTLNSIQPTAAPMMGFVPANYNVRLRPSSITGAPTFTWISGQETLL